MRELQKLDKSLLMAEFDLARDIWEKTQRDGYGQHRSAAIVYKHGFLDGRNTMKAQKEEAYRRLAIAHKILTANGIELPDYRANAATTINLTEGGNNNE